VIRLLTLHQPWATLMAGRVKTRETRSWSTSYRGPVAIHAGKSEEGLTLCADPDFKAGLLRCVPALPWLPADRALQNRDLLPFGAIVAVGHLHEVITTDDAREFDDDLDAEYAFGNYSGGRFAWRFSHLTPVPRPIPFRGAQGLRPIVDESVALVLEDLYRRTTSRRST
jgi:activating signal cointegrator 1